MTKLIKTLVTILLVLVIAIVFFIGVDYFSSKIKDKSLAGQISRLESSENIEKKVEKGKVVTKILDGDTIIADGETIRLLGIDADEKGEKCYDAAKEKLKELLLNKVVDLEYFNEDVDYYGRKLRYVIVDGENINFLLVKQGYVIARVSNDPYKQVLIEAERFARENKVGCKWQENWKETIDACEAYSYIGKNATIEGFILEVKKTTKAAFLNFENPYPNQCFTAVIFASKLSLFPDVYSYKDKKVRVSGLIKEYKGKPEIILENPSQIEILN